MRIAVFVSLFPKLSETFVQNQIIGLIEAGHEVDIFPHDRGTDSVVHEEVYSYHLLDRTFYKPEIPRNWLWRFLKAVWLFMTHFHRNPGALLRSLNIFEYNHLAASLLLFYQTIAVVRGHGEYDIIHCHFGERGNAALAYKKLGAIKGTIVTSFYGQDLTTFGDDLTRHPYAELFQEGALFLPISNFFRNRLIEMGCPAGKIIVNHVGVDFKRFHFHERNLDKGRPLHLLATARLAEKKGLDTAILAVVKAKALGCDCTFNIFGDGPLREKLQQLIVDNGAADYIHINAPVTHDKLESLIREYDVFLLPSVTASSGDMEGIPLSLMEASASGLPVISTWHSGIPELVRDGISGYLVPENDIGALAQRILLLAENREQCKVFGLAGRRIVEEHFNLHLQNDLLLKMFAHIVFGNPIEE